jgi:hypothetical protein
MYPFYFLREKEKKVAHLLDIPREQCEADTSDCPPKCNLRELQNSARLRVRALTIIATIRENTYGDQIVGDIQKFQVR